LTKLAAEDVETLPVGNTWDGHGKYVNHLSKGEVNVVVGYLHKVLPAEEARTALLPFMLDHLLSACRAYEIPVLLIVPTTLHEKAKKILGDIGPNVHLVAPEELEAQIRRYL
jgi:hypothetical protein